MRLPTGALEPRVVFAIAVVVASACGPSSDTGSIRTGSTQVALEPYVGRLRTVDVVVGDDTLRLLFDTGGGQTLLAPDRADAMACEAPGYSVGYRMSGERVEWPTCGGGTLGIRGEAFTDVRYGLWDVMDVLPEGLPPVDGVLSLDVFRGMRVVLDLSGSRLIVEAPEPFRRRVSTMHEVPARAATGESGELLSVFVRVDIEGVGPVWLLVDSANLDVVQVSDRRDLPGDTVTLRLGDLETTAAARSAPLIHDGALSEAVLADLVVAFDLAEMRVWVGLASDG